MISSIMQPYFLPYLGYFQLIHASDLFVVYDNIKYTKKGWINRNRMIRNGDTAVFSLPLKSASDFLPISERVLADSFDRGKFVRQIEGAYAKAPEFKTVMPLVAGIINHPQNGLFDYIHHSLREICNYLEISTPMHVSSRTPVPDEAVGQDKVIALCKHFDSDAYLNLPGGRELYSAGDFEREGIELHFIEMDDRPYPQLADEFFPKLSILDVLMSVSAEEINHTMLPAYTIQRAV